MGFVVFDHKIIDEAQVNLSTLILNSCFFLEQKIWFSHNEMPLFNENFLQLVEKCKLFRLTVPDQAETRELLRLTKRLLNRCRFYKTGIVSVKLFRDNDEVHYLVSAKPSDSYDFPISPGGILVDFADITKHSGNPFSKMDVFCHPVWEHALSQLKGMSADDLLITNEHGLICEAIGANVFFLKGKSLKTPAIETGCYIDTIRQKVLEAALVLDFQVIESERISKEQVYEMEEAFIVSEDKGMKWILGIDLKRFTHFRINLIKNQVDKLMKVSV